MPSKYYSVKTKRDGFWYIVSTLDGSNWWWWYDHLFKFSSEEEGRVWLHTEGYAPEEITNWIEKNVARQHIIDTNDTMAW